MRYLFAIIPILFLAACECAGQHNAQVFDAETKSPVPDAKVSAYKTRDGEEMFHEDDYTDSNGFYSVGYFMGSGTKKCPGFKVYIRKDGYKLYTVTETETLKGEQDTIFLEKE